ncbi:hypothetical protein LEN26_000809, partial [Aphanomyces euteiches]
NGVTPLHHASSHGHMDVVKELLAHGASINRATNQGTTSLHLASSNGHLVLVNKLLAQGAAIEASTVADHTPLHRAAYFGKLNVVKELIVHVGRHSLHLASKSDNVDKVKENDPSVKTTKKTRKHIVASANDQLEVLQLLLDAGAKRL